jgi:hypothetical protein
MTNYLRLLKRVAATRTDPDIMLAFGHSAEQGDEEVDDDEEPNSHAEIGALYPLVLAAHYIYIGSTGMYRG